MSYVGAKQSVAEQYKKIYTKRVIKRGMSEALRKVDELLKLTSFNTGEAVEKVRKSKTTAEAIKAAGAYASGFGQAVSMVSQVWVKYKDWSPAEKKFVEGLLKELKSQATEWTTLKQNVKI